LGQRGISGLLVPLPKCRTVVISGKVRQVYAFEDDQGQGHVDNRFLIEIKVESAEKGGVKPGDLLVVHTWNAVDRPRDSIGPSGYGSPPAPESSVRAYLYRDGDGRFVPLYRNGLSSLDSLPMYFRGPALSSPRAALWWLLLLPAAMCVGALGYFLGGRRQRADVVQPAEALTDAEN
jgi:hypothetical protein